MMTISERLSNYEPLLEALRTVSAGLDYEIALQSVISVASKLTSSEVASILKYDEADEHLHLVAVPWFHRDSIQGVRVPLEESIAVGSINMPAS